METLSAKEEMILEQIGQTYHKARTKHAPMRGPHEGYAIMLEEFDELWDEVKAWQPRPDGINAEEILLRRHDNNIERMRKEALHVAAMAFAFLLEVV